MRARMVETPSGPSVMPGTMTTMTAPETPESPAPRTVLFIGDSITDCGRREDPEALGHGHVRLLAEHLGADCLAHAPDLVTIYVGVNDAWHRYTRGEHIDDADFAQGYRHLLDQLAATVPGAQVLMIVPFVADIDAQTAQIHEDLDGKVAI